MTLGIGNPSARAVRGGDSLERVGDSSTRASHSFGRSTQQGFTLVELLVVMAILMMLAGLIYVAVGSTTKRAKDRATRALIDRLQLDLEAYKRKTGSYPPDGIDSEVVNARGERLKGAAALYQALSQKIVVDTMVAGVPRTVQYDAIEQYEDAVLTDPLEEYPDVRAFKDGFGNELHYDNTQDGVFTPQRGEVHYPPLSDRDHPEDPRALPIEEGGVPVPGQVMSRGYDLWSHGARGHDIDEPINAPIASWNQDNT